MIKYRSIKNKILAPLLVSIVVVFVLFQWINDQFQYNLYRDAKLTHLQTLGRTVSYNLQAPLLFEDAESAQEQIDTFQADGSILSVILNDTLDNTVAAYPSKQDKDWFQSIKFNWELEGSLYASGKLFVYVPIEVENELLGKLKIVADVDYNKGTLQHFIEVASLIALLGVGVLYYLYERLSRLILVPVYKIKNSMTKLLGSSGTMEPITIKQYDELGDLVEGYNTMIARIHARDLQITASMDKLERERNFANELFESLAHGMLVVDRKGIIKQDNRYASRQFGLQGSMIGTNINQYFRYKDKHTILMALLGREHLTDDRLSITSSTGESKTLKVSSLQTTDSEMVLFSIIDITEELARTYKQQLATSIFENSQDAILVVDKCGQILIVNPALERLFGYREADIINESIYEVCLDHELKPRIDTMRQSALEKGFWEGELASPHADGTLIPIWVHARFISATSHSLNIDSDLVLVCQDLRDRKEMERLEHIASHDPLTQLANRAKLLTDTQALIDQKRYGEFGLLFLDLDGFKLINDQWGHDAGDFVLKTVAARLQSAVRDSDLVCRLAGDEFVILMTQSTLQRCGSIAERVLDVVSSPILFEGHTMQVGVSIGIHMTEIDDDETDAIAVIKQADRAMYRAKFLGKGQFSTSRDH